MLAPRNLRDPLTYTAICARLIRQKSFLPVCSLLDQMEHLVYRILYNYPNLFASFSTDDHSVLSPFYSGLPLFPKYFSTYEHLGFTTLKTPRPSVGYQFWKCGWKVRIQTVTALQRPSTDVNLSTSVKLTKHKSINNIIYRVLFVVII